MANPAFDIKTLLSNPNIHPFRVGSDQFYQTPVGILKLSDNQSVRFVSAEELTQLITQQQNRLNQILASTSQFQSTMPQPPSNNGFVHPIPGVAPKGMTSQPSASNTLMHMLTNRLNHPTGVAPNQTNLEYLLQQQRTQQNTFEAEQQLRQQQQNKQQPSKGSTAAVRRDYGIPNLTEEELSKIDEEEEEEQFQAETYSNYMPSKLKIGLPHPDPVVETSSLSSVFPPDIRYELSFPESVIQKGKLSALQLESITYACQQHEVILQDGTRAGFLIGDGAGVGKGRTVAGVIYENYLKGRKKALWLSVSTDLRFDAERDLKDIGADIDVYPLNKFKYSKINSRENGNVSSGIIFATYASLISESSIARGKLRSRLDQLLQWFGKDFDGVIIFDECHRAKNLCPSTGKGVSTKTAKTVLELQNLLPKARVVYASATGATEPRNMAYMVRLGLWGKGTSFETFSNFISTVERRGVGAMELVAIDMKLRGMYIARQLSFAGVNFRIEEIPLSDEFIGVYNECVDLWADALTKFDRALNLRGDDKKNRGTWTQFWASHQRFFKYLCIASKVPFAVELVKESIQEGKSPVIGLQSTGEARTLEHLNKNQNVLTEFISTAKAVFQSLIENHFPASHRSKIVKEMNVDEQDFQELPQEEDLTNRVRSCRRAMQETQKRMQAIHKSNKSKATDDADLTDVDDSEDESQDVVEVSDSDDYTDKSDVSDNESESDFTLSESDASNASADEEEEESEASEDSEEDDSDDSYSGARSNKRKSAKTGGSASKKQKSQKPEVPQAIQVECNRMRDALLYRLEKIGKNLPSNTIDDLIDKLGGASFVAEMTGRKGRVVSIDGQVSYESRAEDDVSLEMLNMAEKDRFMNDEKQIAIISEAASSGISLHADKRVKNQRRRVHITIELPWSADRAIQQFGRTHRSNQANAPEYIFLISELAGEQRFASIVAKRLESLGALTHGDRRATETRDLSRFNVDNRYGRLALDIVMKSIVDIEPSMVKPPTTYHGDFFKDCRAAMAGVGLLICDENGDYNLEKDAPTMTRFLNRILGLRVAIQNAVFEYFSETLEAVIKNHKRMGRYDQGIMDLSSEMGKVQRIDHRVFYAKHSTGITQIELHKVAVDRGMSWEEAKAKYDNCKLPNEGFYINKKNFMIRQGIFLAVADSNLTTRFAVKDIYQVFKPNLGKQVKNEHLSSLKERARKVSLEDAEKHWKEMYNMFDQVCGHTVWFGNCRRKQAKLDCDFGMRCRNYHILSGSVLTVWSHIERVVPQLHQRLQIVRLNIPEDKIRVIGTQIAPGSVNALTIMLEEEQAKHLNDDDMKKISSKVDTLSDGDTEIDEVSDDDDY